MENGSHSRQPLWFLFIIFLLFFSLWIYIFNILNTIAYHYILFYFVLLKEGKECKEKCYSDPPEKPGQCGNQSNPFYKNCINECDSHKDCPSLDLCCRNECGKTCQMPENLENTPGIYISIVKLLWLRKGIIKKKTTGL